VVPDGGTQVPVPRTSVSRLRVQKGRHVDPRRALAFPILGGALGGVAGWLIACGRCSGWDSLGSGKGAAVGVAVGFSLGLLVGARGVEVWEEIPLDQLRASFVPKPDGRFAVGVTLKF